MKSYTLLLRLLIMVIQAGCASPDPGSVTRDRFDCNESLAKSRKRQLLQNIVKMRYAEPLFFMDLGQIVSGYSFETCINMSAIGTVSDFNGRASVNSSIFQVIKSALLP